MVSNPKAFRSAYSQDAELSDDGAAGFLRELVKSDLADEYGLELRRWIAEVESNSGYRRNRSNNIVPDGTTRIAVPRDDAADPDQGQET